MVELGKRARNVFNRPTAPTVGPQNGSPTLRAPSACRAIMGTGVGHSPWRGSKPKAPKTSFQRMQAPHSARPFCRSGALTTTWESLAVWRSESAVSWTHQRMRAGLHVLTLANQWWLEGWGAWTLQTEWPLHLTAGFETWQLEGSPNMPNEGLRWRVGVSHTLVMSPGRPTFAQPCCP